MSIFPVIDPQVAVQNESKALPLYREVAWDFENDVPRFRGREPIIVEGKEALKVWIWRALRTARYRYEIYTWDYGSEFESLLGQAYTDSVKTAEAPRYLRECLLINPYITAVKSIEVDFASATLTVKGTAVTVYGEVDFFAAIRGTNSSGHPGAHSGAYGQHQATDQGGLLRL